MVALLIIALIGVAVIWRFFNPKVDKKQHVHDSNTNKLGKLWEIAQEALTDRKYLRAEKALLTILRIDQKNAAAYNRLGIIYARQKAYKDAIECFEIAQSLEPNASSLHNVGLIYFETEDYAKSVLAYEQALALDDTLAARHIAYAKALEKVGNKEKMVNSLETAVKMEPSIQSYQILIDAYRHANLGDKADLLETKLKKIIEKHNTPKRVRQPQKRVVM
jgi:tetratricopeptide (TPR) repeat protein